VIGGLIPLVKAGRDRHAVENTWWIEITWLRVLLRAEATR
jgi:hypothetical protein